MGGFRSGHERRGISRGDSASPKPIPEFAGGVIKSVRNLEFYKDTV